MKNSRNNSKGRSRGVSIMAFLFLLIAIFLLTGFLPQCLNYLDTDNIELSENLEDETEEKEKETEKKTDTYHSESKPYMLLGSQCLTASDVYFRKWKSPSADIIIPPPDSPYC